MLFFKINFNFLGGNVRFNKKISSFSCILKNEEKNMNK